MFEDVLEMAPSAKTPPPHAAQSTVLAEASTTPTTVQRLVHVRRRLRWTMARTSVPKDVQPRIVAFDRGLAIAVRLAHALGASANEASGAQDKTLSMQAIVKLAYRGLDAGFTDDGLAVLGSVGMLIGGTPRAAFETALGLVRLGRNAEACERLTHAIEGMTDTEGVVSALLAQLWFEAGDSRWIVCARRVLATGSDRDARIRCMELLTVHSRG